MLPQSGFAAYQVDRRAFLGSGFGQEQGAVGKIESGLSVFACDLRSLRLPVKPSGDHEVNDEKEFTFQHEDDTLAEAAELYDFLSFRRANRRIEGAQNKRTADTDLLYRLIQHPFRERLDIDGNIRKLRHVSGKLIGYRLTRL